MFRLLKNKRNIVYLITGYAAVLLISFIFHYAFYYPEHEIRVESDGIGYYSYLRSVFFDGDIEFSNEFERLGSDDFALPSPDDRTGEGYTPNPFSIGPGILWSPFYICAHMAGYAMNMLGADIVLDGYSGIYVYFCVAGTIFYGYLGLYLLFKMLSIFFSKTISFSVTGFILFGSALFYYMISEYFMSHVHSFFAVTLLLYFIFIRLDRERGSETDWFFAGLISGFAGIIRWQNIGFAIVPAFLLILNTCREYKKAGRKRVFTGLIRRASLFGAGFIIIIIPQMIIIKMIYGFWFGIPQGQAFFSFDILRMFYVLFSPYHGLFQWHPILLFGFAGLILSGFKSLKNLFFLMAFIIQVYIVSLPYDWWAGHSFGMRRLLNSSALLAFGLSGILYALSRKNRAVYRIIYLVFIVFCLINILMSCAYVKSLIPHDIPWSYIQSLESIIFLVRKIMLKLF